MKLKIKRGLWIVFTFNIVVAAIVWWAGSNLLTTAFSHPVFTDFVDSIPTITVKDKTVQNPLDLNTSRSLGNMPLLYIQTDRDYIGVGAIQDGIYITKKAVSILNNGATQAQFELPENGIINPEKIHTYFHRFAIWAPALLSLLYIVRLWIFYFVLVGLFALFTLIPAIRKKLAPYAVWRYAAYAHVGVLSCDFIGSYFGYGLPTITYMNFNLPIWLGVSILFFITMLVQWLVAWLVADIIMLVAILRQDKVTKSIKKKN